MADRDELLSEMPAVAHDIQRVAGHLAADDYSRPRRPREFRPGPILGGHGESVPAPAVSGGSDVPPPPRPVATGLPDPDYRGGAMVPIEYVLAEGSDASGREMVHSVVRRNGHRWEAALQAIPAESSADYSNSYSWVTESGIPDTSPAPRIEPTESYVNAPSQSSARESVVLVAFVVLLVASLLWGAAGMPL